MFDLAASKGLQLSLLDIGGGFPGLDGSERLFRDGVKRPSSPTTVELPLSCEDISRDIVPLIDELFPASSGIKVWQPEQRGQCASVACSGPAAA